MSVTTSASVDGDPGARAPRDGRRSAKGRTSRGATNGDSYEDLLSHLAPLLDARPTEPAASQAPTVEPGDDEATLAIPPQRRLLRQSVPGLRLLGAQEPLVVPGDDEPTVSASDPRRASRVTMDAILAARLKHSSTRRAAPVPEAPAPEEPERDLPAVLRRPLPLVPPPPPVPAMPRQSLVLPPPLPTDRVLPRPVVEARSSSRDAGASRSRARYVVGGSLLAGACLAAVLSYVVDQTGASSIEGPVTDAVSEEVRSGR